jgi:hypothetical protein
VGTTWRLNLDRVAATSPAAVQLLWVASFLAPEAIPPDLLGADPQILPAELAQAANDELVLDEAVGALYRYSLVTRDHEGIRVHRLVQAVARADLGDQEPEWARLAVRLVLAAFPINSHEVAAWPTCERLLAHLLAVTDHAERLGVAPEKTGDLLHRASTYLPPPGVHLPAGSRATRAGAAAGRAGPDPHPANPRL